MENTSTHEKIQAIKKLKNVFPQAEYLKALGNLVRQEELENNISYRIDPLFCKRLENITLTGSRFFFPELVNTDTDWDFSVGVENPTEILEANHEHLHSGEYTDGNCVGVLRFNEAYITSKWFQLGISHVDVQIRSIVGYKAWRNSQLRIKETPALLEILKHLRGASKSAQRQFWDLVGGEND
jgi:hypothetical protein